MAIDSSWNMYEGFYIQELVQFVGDELFICNGWNLFLWHKCVTQ
jgi:hypothetical protein